MLHEGQLVFHTPPYSLQPVSLQECYEYVNKGNVRGSRNHGLDTKSPLPQKHENILTQHKIETSPNSTLGRSNEKGDKTPIQKIGSPLSAERKGRRFSYSNTR